MEDFFDGKILDELFETRRDGFEYSFTKKYGESEEAKVNEQLREKLENAIKKFVQNKEEQNQLLNIVEEFDESSIDLKWFWAQVYYKFGFSDRLVLEKEMKEKEDEIKQWKI